MSEYADQFLRLAPKMVPFFKKLVEHEVRHGKRIYHLIDFVLDSKFELDLWLNIPYPIIKIEKFHFIDCIWADDQYLAIQFFTKDGGHRVVIYDSNTNFRLFLPFNRLKSIKGCFAPLVCNSDVFVLYFTGKIDHYSFCCQLVSFKQKELNQYSFDNLGRLQTFCAENLKSISANDKKRIIAFLNSVLEGKKTPSDGWVKAERYSSDLPYWLDTENMRWAIFDVSAQNGQTILYVQKIKK